ncbi:ATP-dependent nuclease [Bradyrhizobium guangdongense]
MKHLSTLSIEHFRGILDKQELSFAIPTGQKGSGLTILVGPNNVGKSTIIEALRSVVTPPAMIDKRERHLGQALRISIKDTANGFREITNPGLNANIAATGSAHPSNTILRYIPSRRSWAHRTNAPTMQPSDYWAQRSVFPRQEDLHLISRLNSFSPEEKIAFQRALSEVAPQLHDWNIEYSDGSTFLEYVTVNGAAHTADLFGDGIASLFRIVLALYDPQESLIVIDEPELSLHPQAQKRLARFVSNKAADRQIILCTHSPYFVNWSDLIEGARIYRLKQDRSGIHANCLADETITSLTRLSDDWQKPQLLDAVAKEVFFADEVLFLEGQEDVSLITRFIEAEGAPAIQLFGYGVGGSKNTLIFFKMATELGIPCGAMFDRTSMEDHDRARATFPSAKIEIIPTDDIRDKPGAAGKSAIDGLFFKNGAVKPEHRGYLLAILHEYREYFDDGIRP